MDGFNLYCGALKDTAHKWLDLKALFTGILRPQNQIQKIKYYTARVSARPDDLDAATPQDIYLRALELHQQLPPYTNFLLAPCVHRYCAAFLRT